MNYSKKEIEEIKEAAVIVLLVLEACLVFLHFEILMFFLAKREAATVVVLLVWEASLVLLQQINHGM